MVRRHRPDRWATGRTPTADDPRTRADLIDELVKWTPQTGPQPALLDDRGAARLGAVAPARLGRAADLFREEGRGARPTRISCCATRRSTPASSRRSRPKARMLVQAGRQGAVPGQRLRPEDYEQVFDILDVWFDSAAPPMPSCCATARRDRGRHRRSLPRRHRPASRLVPFLAAAGLRHHRARALPQRGDPRLHARREGHEDVQVARQHRRARGGVKQYGADILRLWVAQSDYTADQRIGPEILKGTADSYRRLRNTMRFMLGNRWRISPRPTGWTRPRCRSWNAGCCTGWPNWTTRCARATPPIDFQGVFQALFNFATTDLSAFYFDIRKDALYCDGDTLRRRRRARCWISCSTG
jgi:isoleucyl-tRNA synthetase